MNHGGTFNSLIDNCLNVDGDFHSYDSCNIHSHNVFNKNALRYLSLNVCGIKIKSKYPELRDLLDNYDIICLTETKLDDIDVIECNDFTFKYVKLKSMYVLRSVSSPQICVFQANPSPIKLLYPQIRVLLPRRYVSFGIASHSTLCTPKSIFPQICVLHFGRKMTS